MFYFNFLEVSNAKTYVLASNILDGMATPILWVGKFGQLRTMETVTLKSDLKHLVLRHIVMNADMKTVQTMKTMQTILANITGNAENATNADNTLIYRQYRQFL